MSNAVLSSRLSQVRLEPAPIDPTHIIEGRPVARSCILSQSDAIATAVWDCTAGTFNWFYGAEETVHILEGEVTVTGRDGTVHNLTPGDIALFLPDNWVRWHVPCYVRKFAVLRRLMPVPSLVRHVIGRAQRKAFTLLRGKSLSPAADGRSPGL